MESNKGLYAKNAIVIATVAVALFAGALGGLRQAVRPDVFAKGILIDDADVSGLSYTEAEKLVLKSAHARISDIVLPVNYQGRTVLFSADELGIGTNAKDVLEQAFHYNKQQKDSLAERFDKSVRPEGKTFQADIVIDDLKLRDTVAEFCGAYSRPPVDAQALFRKDTKTFLYIPGKSGTEIDVEQMTVTIMKRIEKGDFSELEISGNPVDPPLTLNTLKENTVSIGVCTTSATDDENRNTNIRLMCEAIDGLKIMPGGVLSLNQLVGERTSEKGFKSAPAIIDGKKLTNELGGGICQVSGTLYNAALLADMGIVERVHHSWPSSYLPVGLDSTLNWDDKDLKIKNMSEYPVYISATFQDGTVKVELYGAPLPDGVTVEVENNVLKKIDPPAPDIIYTNELPVGERRTQVSPREGYEVEVTRSYLLEGKLLDYELISKDYYPAVKGVILEGTDAQEK